jgi:hypothetical protein
LHGCPSEIGAAFNVSNNNLKNLVNGPKKIGGQYQVSDNDLTSLIGCASEIPGEFNVSSNKLSSLEHGPKIVCGSYYATDNDLVSVVGIPTMIDGSLHIEHNPLLTSLKGIRAVNEMFGKIYLGNNPITSHILGVFFIKGCRGIKIWKNGDLGRAVDIVNRHIQKGRTGLLPCQQELIEAGLADFAQI